MSLPILIKSIVLTAVFVLARVLMREKTKPIHYLFYFFMVLFAYLLFSTGPVQAHDSIMQQSMFPDAKQEITRIREIVDLELSLGDAYSRSRDFCCSVLQVAVNFGLWAFFLRYRG
jgi:hypothetical protein